VSERAERLRGASEGKGWGQQGPTCISWVLPRGRASTVSPDHLHLASWGSPWAKVQGPMSSFLLLSVLIQKYTQRHRGRRPHNKSRGIVYCKNGTKKLVCQPGLGLVSTWTRWERCQYAGRGHRQGQARPRSSLFLSNQRTVCGAHPIQQIPEASGGHTSWGPGEEGREEEGGC
jgi:hypothetical protein